MGDQQAPQHGEDPTETTRPDGQDSVDLGSSVESEGEDIKPLLRGGSVGRWWRNRREDAAIIRDQAFYRERDPEENEASKPPPQESCQLAAVWVAEVYTPSTLTGLVEGLRKRGWDSTGGRDQDVVEWVSRSRVRGAGSWMKIGFVRRRGEGFADLHDELPSCVRAVELKLFAVTPSVTVLVAGFFLTEDAAIGYHDKLASDYATVLRPLPRDRGRPVARTRWRVRYGSGWMARRGHSIEGPYIRRRDAARDYVTSMKRQCEEWLETRFPGAFTNGLLGGSFAAAALFVTEDSEPFPDDAPQWMRVAGLGRAWGVWRSEELPGCGLVLPEGSADDTAHLMRLALRREEAREWPLDDPSNWYIVHRVDDALGGLFSKWAVLSASYGQREALAQARDLTPGKREHRVIEDLRELRARVASSSLDAQLLARELDDLAQDGERLRYHTIEFKRPRPGQEETVELLDLVAENLRLHAEDLGRVNQLLLDATTSMASLTAAISSVRLQRAVMALTFVSLLLGVLALAIAITNAG